MTTALCMAWLVIAGAAIAAEPAEKPSAKGDGKVQAVIDEVERVCLERRIRLLAP